MSTTEEKKSWIAETLAGFGVPANWAKVIAGAIIGALAAAGLLTLDSCTASIDIMPDGAQRWEGTLELPPDIVTDQK